MTGFPTVFRTRLRAWSVVTLVVGVLLGGTALAVAGTDKKSDEYGEMGASPIPVVSAVSGPTAFRISSFNILGWDHTERGGSKAKAGYADGAQCPCDVRCEHAGPAQPLLERVGCLQQIDEASDIRLQDGKGHHQIAPGRTVQVTAHAARSADTAQEATSRQALVESLERLLDAGTLAGPDGEPDARAHVPEIADVIVQTLQLQEDRAERRSPRRRCHAGECLDGLTVRDGM